MTEIRFEVPGEPCAKGRPRMTVRGKHAHAYTPEKTARYENLVKLCANAARPREPFDGPLAVDIVAVFERPKRLADRYRDGRLKCGCESRIPHTSRPDLDNNIKAILDGSDGSGIWGDDAQVTDLTASKWYAAIGELPHVEIRIRPLPVDAVSWDLVPTSEVC